MSAFPKDKATYNDWADNLSKLLKEKTNGQVRIGKNKLAAYMAMSLPNTDENFNINTLIDLLENEQVKSEESALLLKENAVKSLSNVLYKFFNYFADNIHHNLKHIISVDYDTLNCEGDVVDFFSDQLINVDHNIIQWVSENDVFKLSTKLHHLSYLGIDHEGTFNGEHYRRIVLEETKDNLYDFLNVLTEVNEKESLATTSKSFNRRTLMLFFKEISQKIALETLNEQKPKLNYDYEYWCEFIKTIKSLN